MSEKKETNIAQDTTQNLENAPKETPQNPYDKITFETVDSVATDPEFLKYLEIRGKKLILTNNLPADLKEKIEVATRELTDLKNNVLEKEQSILKKSTNIKNKVENLVKSGKINIDIDEYKKSEISILRYSYLLRSICAEIENECAYLVLYLKEEHPSHTVVQIGDTDNFSDHISKKISYAKRYIKNISRDLSVSYSRYSYGFDAQEKKMDMIERVVLKKVD